MLSRRVGPRRVEPEGWGPEGCCPEGWGPEGWGPEGWGPEGWGPEGWGPEGWGPEPRRSGSGCSTTAPGPEDVEPGGVRRGWQHSARNRTGGPGAGAAQTAVPTGRETTILLYLFWVIFLQTPPTTSLHGPCLPMWPSPRRFLATIAQHVPVLGCLDAEVSHWRVPLQEFAEKQGPSADQHIHPGLGHSHSNVGGQPPTQHGGAQLPVDTTLVSTLHGDGRPRKGAVDRDAVALLASPYLSFECPKLIVAKVGKTVVKTSRGQSCGQSWSCQEQFDQLS